MVPPWTTLLLTECRGLSIDKGTVPQWSPISYTGTRPDWECVPSRRDSVSGRLSVGVNAPVTQECYQVLLQRQKEITAVCAHQFIHVMSDYVVMTSCCFDGSHPAVQVDSVHKTDNRQLHNLFLAKVSVWKQFGKYIAAVLHFLLTSK